MEYNKVYLIMGSSSDIGVELIHKLNEHQCNSLFICHYFSSSEKLKQIEAQNGNNIACVQADLADIEQTQRLIIDVQDRFGVPTHIVHLPATTIKYQRYKDFDWSSFQVDFEVQVHSILEICKTFLPVMAKRKSYNKIVIMLTSYTLDTPPKFLSHYVIAKYALLGLLNAIAVEYADKRVNINGISPSMMETKFLGSIDPRYIEMAKETTIEKRLLQVEEVVPSIEFLLSDQSNSIHGTNLNISGGNTIL